MITKNTMTELKNYISKNYKISCYIPVEVAKTSLNNVVGYLKGTNSKASPVIVSAHFDHIGSDLSGNIYSGALDNASGISFVLEFIKYIKSLGTPERNIIFIGFNAEEFGCLGSEHFAKKYSGVLKGAKVYNFDMIGSNSVPLSIMGGKADDSKTDFMRSISLTFSTEKIKYNFLFEDASDHEAFRKYNIDAVTFCDSDTSKIHTPNDKAEFINTEAIDRCFKVASIEIIKNAFNEDPMLIHYKKTLFISFWGFILFSIIYRIQTNNG
jgi:Zn-dependent M28 family amino/carboxypeptidase